MENNQGTGVTDPLLNNVCRTSDLPAKTPPSPRKEHKISLSEYHTDRPLSLSGEETQPCTSQEPVTCSVPPAEHVHANVVIENTACVQNPKTSTPIRQNVSVDIDSATGAVGFSPVRGRGTGSSASSGSSAGSIERPARRTKHVSFIDPLDLRVPLLGFEVMEQRAKFTVFKLHVHKGKTDDWFVFRRYTDFVQLQQRLKRLFPMFRLPLPPKRWFRNNYEKEFLDDRMCGLQAFIDSVLCHSDLCNCGTVQEFFCLTDPPGPHDSVEESRAYCEALEDSVYNLRKEAHDKDTEIELLRDELALYKSQVEMLSTALREANTTGAISNNSLAIPSSKSANSLAECDFMAPEADQSNSVLQIDSTSKRPAKLKTSQSEVSIQQEIDEVTAAAARGKSAIKDKKDKQENKRKSSAAFQLSPSSSSIN